MKYIFLFVTILLSFFGAMAQVQIDARLDSTEMRIGSQAKLILEAEIPTKTSLIFPTFVPLDTIVKGVEVVQVSKFDTIALDNNQIKVSQELMVTSFDAGEYILNFKFSTDEDTLQTADLPLSVRTIQVDTVQAEVKDVKPVYSVPLSWKTILTYTFFVLLIITLLSVLGYFIWKKMQKKPVVLNEEKTEEPPVPPHITALQKLDEIKAAGLWQRGDVKEFHIRLTDVLREYIEKRFGLNALEMTSDEIINAMMYEPQCKPLLPELSQTLRLADLVKFAKTKPTEEENEQSLASGYIFVKQTMAEI